MDRAEWLAERRKGVGSSDAPVICGLSPYMTPAALYYEKKGVEFSRTNLFMDMGTFLEPKIAQLFTERTGLNLEIPEPLIKHPLHPWMFANLDRRALGSIIVELKAAFTREGWGPDGSDEIPEQYILQVQHQLAVTGHRTAFVAALLVTAGEFRVFKIERNESLIEAVIAKERAFWGRVQRDDPPPLDYGHSSTLDMLGELYGYNAGERLLLPHELEDSADRYVRAQKVIKEAEQIKDEEKARLLEHMGSAAEAVLPNGTVLKRRQVKRSGYTVQPTEYVAFSAKPPVTTGEPK